MPHERITASREPVDVNVSWSRDGGYVQVATTCEEPERVARLAAAIQAGEHLSGTLTGWHVDLNRDQINQLVRVLRRARDMAFGRDE